MVPLLILANVGHGAAVWPGEMEAQGSLPVHLPKVRIGTLPNVS